MDEFYKKFYDIGSTVIAVIFMCLVFILVSTALICAVILSVKVIQLVLGW